MNNNKYNELLFDAMLAEAFCEAAQDEIAQIDWQSEDKHEFSVAHVRKAKKILAQYKRLERTQKMKRAMKWAAMITLIVLSISFASLMTVEAVRNEVIRVVTEWFEQYTDVGFDVGDDRVSIEEIDLRESGALIPSYVPEGYVLQEIIRNEMRIVAIYENEEGLLLIYQQKTTDGTSSVDNEHHDIKIIELMGYEAMLSIPNESILDSSILIWNDGRFTYNIECVCSVEELITIAESLEKEK